ncbi:hypothetical protein NI377_09250 [Vibrio parahaemolyticus]|nr:hypothetical protein NI377_09250 [Vibrio parahaemolyticus]
MKDRDAFYVVARESGSEKNDLPVWASKLPKSFCFEFGQKQRHDKS